MTDVPAPPAAPEDREAKFGGPPPPRTIEQRWILATQGILTELNRTSHLRVGGEPRPSHSGLSAFRLRAHWGVRSPREARERVRWLLAEGHRFAFARDTDRSPDEFLGWDLVRASCVAGWSHVAYHLELDEAWAMMREAARGLRTHFASWSEVGASYGAGKSVWSRSPAGDVDDVTARLVAPGAGWDLAWDVDLSGDVPPPAPEVLPELWVDASGEGGAFKTIGEAVRSSKSPKRVRVRAGVYEESVRIQAPIELLAEGDVTVRNGNGAPLVADHHAFVRGFRFEAGHDAEGTKMQAAWVGANFARIVDCALSTERCGVYAGKKRGEVIVERCTATEPGIHGMMIEGGAHMTLLDCTVERPKGSGVMTLGDGELHADGLRVAGAATPALTFNGDNAIELRDVTVEDCAAHGVQVLGTSVLRAFDLRVQGSRGVGVLFASTNRRHSEIHGGVLTGNAGNDLGVLGGGASVHAVELGGGPTCAMCVQNDGRLQLEGCKVAPTVHPSLWLMGSSLTVLIDCVVRNEGELCVFVDEGASVRLVGCDVEASTKSAVVLRGVKEALLLGGRFASADSCVHADRQSEVLVRDATLEAVGTTPEASPAIASIEGADIAVVGGRITAAGGQAVVAEGGGKVALTRAAVSAPNGAALRVDGGEVRVLGGEVTAARGAAIEGDGKVWAEPLGPFEEGGGVALELRPDALAPFDVVLLHHGRAGLLVDPDALRSALAPLDLEPDPFLCGHWLALALEALELRTAFEIGRFAKCIAIESDDFQDLRRVAEHLRGVLEDPERRAALAARLSARLDEEEARGGDE